MDIVSDSNPPIRYKGQEFGPLTTGDLGELQKSLPFIPRELRPFCSWGDMSRYMRSPLGTPVVMQILCGKTGANTKNLTLEDCINIVVEAVEQCYAWQPPDSEEEGEYAPPLAESPSTTPESHGPSGEPTDATPTS